MGPKCTEEEFINLWTKLGPEGTAANLGMQVRNVYARRRRIERRLGINLMAPRDGVMPVEPTDRVRRKIELKEGVVIVGSDAHYWPDEVSTAHLAFVELCKKLNPAHVILNGDMFDGARISRHPPLGWEHMPTVAEEFEVVQTRLMEIRNASPDARHWWTLGNHDARFEARLASAAPEFEGIAGTHLRDHFPDFTTAMSIWINDEVVVKHNWKGGDHAAFNNAKSSGKTIVTGHTHRQLVRPFNDYNGVRYGIECGTLCEPYARQFDYSNDNPRDHTSGFCVLTFKDSRLLYPELVRVVKSGVYEFRGDWHDVENPSTTQN
ncbi:MAG: metallophosphoesterase [Candidatus Latescibacterota bacterium]|nr:MAG: metallophosphoesterase [Candidatus Latescibacterota bacterium]